MKWKECKTLIREDLYRITLSDNMSYIKVTKLLLSNASFMVTFWFRLGNYLNNKRGAWRVAYWVVYMYYKHQMFKTGIQLPIGTSVGGGLRFFHFSNIVVNQHVIIGRNVSIYNGVTIGQNSDSKGCSFIDDNVVIFTGAKVIGTVRIGKNAVIGANAVVLKDVPDNAVMAGIPAKVVSYKGEVYSRYIINHG